MATIRKRGGTYQIRVSLGYDKNGNHKEQAMTWRPTRVCRNGRYKRS